MRHKMLDAGASVMWATIPTCCSLSRPSCTARTAATAVIFYSLGNFLSNQSRNYVDGLMPDKDGDPRDSMDCALSPPCAKIMARPGVRVELGSCGDPACMGREQPQRTSQRSQQNHYDPPSPHDREDSAAQARLDDLTNHNTAHCGAKQGFVEGHKAAQAPG